MKAVVTRCSSASVEVDGEIVGELPRSGLLALIGVTHTDDERECEKIARKIAGLRILEDEKSATDLNAPVLLVSQFTLYGDARKGRRPSWSAAASGAVAEPLIDRLQGMLEGYGLHVESGVFGAMMRVASVNDGPFTVLLDSAEIA
ncbi:D-aminoacyl-tRNA deacylase [Gulosibacter molinativorax]|uniref:D-aminoacyl-tRNA deacylase n=1 Tax=Gulosibacter molinativorax TaxID=256821 RepID=A0ABT7C6K5_9MICO|nr:D-aminoacyl-tRNA deacylase [Gulosibacter molinativorax]MDJ1370825.1 D-tyrosyl-tRNA(Tyr) deacylase [Gulosibacter molinativorax]QUY62162.1 D-aminoacyl-tRNA deacylase [Gulosibacter molinativorax]